MVSHASLVAEIEIVSNMSTEDRLMHARQRRQEQIQRWRDAELEHEAKGAKLTNGDVPSSKRIVKFGASVTLLEAAARDDIDEVQSLLDGKTDPNEANDDGLTALHQACIDNFEDMVKLLIKYGGNVNAVDSEHWTPLHAACTCGHTNIATILIESGADLLALNADHNMPYDICEDEETLDYVEKSMASKGITQEQINKTRSSKERKIITDMQALVEQGRSLDRKDEVGATVLHIAAANGYVDLTRYLLLHSCKVNMQDDDGWTPLHAAACWNQLDVVDLLGQQGADPTVKNSIGELPADVTDDDEIKALLIKIKSTMKDRRPKKLFAGFRGFSSRNNSRRASGIRGQSFKGRSKRDKKSGISTIEAKSEAQFWSGQQESADIIKPQPSVDNNNHIQKESSVKNDSDDLDRNQVKNGSSSLKKDPAPCADETDLNTISAANHSKSDPSMKKDKKLKKAKRPQEIDCPSGVVIPPDQSNLNGTRSSGNLLGSIGIKSQYKVVESDNWNTPYDNDHKTSSGKTLAELKRERAQEKSNKASPLTPDGDHSPTTKFGSYVDDRQCYKGQTASELSGRSQKKKLCTIL